jgi:CfrBI restriction endonuclease
MTISNAFPENAKDLLLVRGRDLLDTLGLPALRSVVSQVLCGVNIRNATETLTQRRISLLNAAMLETYTNLAKDGYNFEQIIDSAFSEIRNKKTSSEEKIVLRWMLGLTQKQVQNVLRSDDTVWKQYVENLKMSLSSSADKTEDLYGEFPLLNAKDAKSDLDWSWGLSLLMAIGSQTLATRGSEKSLYGKFFEKMIMGSVLSVLGFDLAFDGNIGSRSFTLSTTSKRESDATAIWNLGEGIRFDIGFIGRGNPEITLDKVTRFERDFEISGVKTHLKTFIIVDVVGPRSGIIELAKRADGIIIQMSASDWVKTLGEELENALNGFKSPLSNLNHREYVKFIEEGVKNAPLEEIFNISISAAEEEVDIEDE